jgi:hypothetical protein
MAMILSYDSKKPLSTADVRCSCHVGFRPALPIINRPAVVKPFKLDTFPNPSSWRSSPSHLLFSCIRTYHGHWKLALSFCLHSLALKLVVIPGQYDFL